jgi:hypothetical protein
MEGIVPFGMIDCCFVAVQSSRGIVALYRIKQAKSKNLDLAHWKQALQGFEGSRGVYPALTYSCGSGGCCRISDFCGVFVENDVVKPQSYRQSATPDIYI